MQFNIIALDSQKVNLMDQRFTYTVLKNRAFDELVKTGLRHTRQQLFFIDSFGELFREAAQPGQCTAGVDMKHGFRQTSKIGKQVVFGPQEFEIHRFHKDYSKPSMALW